MISHDIPRTYHQFSWVKSEIHQPGSWQWQEEDPDLKSPNLNGVLKNSGGDSPPEAQVAGQKMAGERKTWLPQLHGLVGSCW